MSDRKSIRLASAEFLFPVFLFVLVFYLFLQTRSMPLRPRQVPFGITLFTLFFLVILILRNIRGWVRSRDVGEAPKSDRSNYAPIVTGFLMLLFYIVLTYAVGYVIASLLYSAGTMIYFGRRDKWTIIGCSAGTVAVIYIAFELVLGIKLPRGWIGSLLS